MKGVPAAVESMKLLYELAFDELRLQRIYGTVAADNLLMIKWQKFFGMQEEGRLRRHYCISAATSRMPSASASWRRNSER